MPTASTSYEVLWQFAQALSLSYHSNIRPEISKKLRLTIEVVVAGLSRASWFRSHHAKSHNCCKDGAGKDKKKIKDVTTVHPIVEKLSQEQKLFNCLRYRQVERIMDTRMAAELCHCP